MKNNVNAIARRMIAAKNKHANAAQMVVAADDLHTGVATRTETVAYASPPMEPGPT